jgi:hypothetical protein
MLKIFRLVLRLFGFGPHYSVIICDDVPDKPAEKRLYVVGEKSVYWQAAMKCPCGCGDLIQLPLTQDARPRWRAQVDKVTSPSLSPSVNRTTGCRSHFFLREGRIVWCP